jgi:hypothetical protein
MAADLNDPMVVLRMVAIGGPPVLYARGDDGTLAFRCGYCGPEPLTTDEAFTVGAHDPACPWRLAAELIRRLDEGEVRDGSPS